MKRTLMLVSVGAFLFTLPAFADKKKGLADEMSGQGYGMAGCGLGSIVFGSKPGMVQVLAATTNGTFYSQTFGITSGTSNCVEHSRMGMNRVPLFIEANRLALSNDIARGNGEALANLSEVLGCSNTGHLGSALQRNYGRLFPSQSTGADQVSNALLGVVKTDAVLANDCKNVI